MPFFTYDDSTRSRFDLTTQKQLNRLMQRFGGVELKEITESSEWCIRIMTGEGDDAFPLAALGDTAYEAAIRLTRMVQNNNDNNTAPS